MLTVVGLGLGDDVEGAAVPAPPAGGRAFAPAGERLRRRLAAAGWAVRPLTEVSTATDGDAVFLLGGPEPQDPWLGRLPAGQRVTVHRGETLLSLAGGDPMAIVPASALGAGVPAMAAAVLGLEGRLTGPVALPGRHGVVLRAGEAPRDVAADELAGFRFEAGDVLFLPAAAVPALAQMARLAVLMAWLRAPGGCPWDREQTHESLVPYLLEEAAEAADAILAGELYTMTEELGDLLLQVVFHAEIGREAGRFTLEDVAEAIGDKLVRRHPHVFGKMGVDSAEQVLTLWHELKRAEKGDRRPSEAVPRTLGALEQAVKVAALLRRWELPAAVEGDPLWRFVAEGVDAGADPALGLRHAVRRLLERLDRLGDPDRLPPEERRRRWQNLG
jgi:XTP/dITP diphosphohydrolase